MRRYADLKETVHNCVAERRVSELVGEDGTSAKRIEQWLTDVFAHIVRLIAGIIIDLVIPYRQFTSIEPRSVQGHHSRIIIWQLDDFGGALLLVVPSTAGFEVGRLDEVLFVNDEILPLGPDDKLETLTQVDPASLLVLVGTSVVDGHVLPSPFCRGRRSLAHLAV